jgi:hypothetical protein
MFSIHSFDEEQDDKGNGNDLVVVLSLLATKNFKYSVPS